MTSLRLIFAGSGGTLLVLLGVLSGHSLLTGNSSLETIPAALSLTMQWLAMAAGLGALTVHLTGRENSLFYPLVALGAFSFGAIWLVDLLYQAQVIGRETYYTGKVTALLVELGAGTYLLGALFRSQLEELRRRYALIASAGVFLLATAASFLPLTTAEQPAQLVALPWLIAAKNGCWLLAPLVFLGAAWRQQVTSHKNLWSQLALLWRRQEPQVWLPLLTLLGCAAVNLILFALKGGQGLTASKATLWQQWDILGWLALSMTGLWVAQRDQRQGLVTESLVSQAAKNFLGRHAQNHSAWAATAAAKSALFFIHHDPQGHLQAHIPQTILQIRSEEIERCISDVLAERQLFLHNVNGSMTAAINGEYGSQPMVTALSALSCLYLDAGPLIERRLERLAKLLPIIDPGLGQALEQSKSPKLVDRGQWFFFVDFDWIDQSMTHTPVFQNYSIHMGQQSDISRLELMSQMAETVGNLLWLTAVARERLVLEAPFLATTVESQPLSRKHMASEELYFTIKFEQLIPRLQRYCQLDSYRESLLDYRPTSENSKLLTVMERQAESLTSPGAASAFLDSLTNFPWQGFREKDHALSIITKTYYRGCELLKETNQVESFRQEVLAAINAVGYPSQVLHQAHQQKRAIRDLAQIKDILQQPRHRRFGEVWLLLSTAEADNFTAAERCELAEYVVHLPVSLFGRNPMLSGKALDFLVLHAKFSLGTDASEGALHSLEDFSRNCLNQRCPLDVLNRILDGFDYLGRFSQAHTSYPSQGLRVELDQAVQHKLSTLNPGTPEIVALESRWQNLTSRWANANAA